MCPCPTGFPAGYYWYGPKQKGPSHPPKWIETLLSEKKQNNNSANNTDEQASGRQEEIPLAQDEANEESNVEDLPDDHTVSPDQRETSR